MGQNDGGVEGEAERERERERVKMCDDCASVYAERCA